jgi:hypothetical protein
VFVGGGWINRPSFRTIASEEESLYRQGIDSITV